MTKVLEALTEINLDDLVSSFGWEGRPILEQSLRAIYRRPARKFARNMAAYDTQVGSHGLMDASIMLMQHFARRLRVFGQENLPQGAFIALSNHPGMIDTLALFAALSRPDLRIIAVPRPFLQAMPNIDRRLHYVQDDPRQSVSLIRQVSRHLKSDGAVLTFPSGKIEPDPDVYPGAVQALSDWTPSAGVFLRVVPEAVIVPVLVRGVILARTAHHPLTVFKKTRFEKEKLSAALQLMAHTVFKDRSLDVTVQIGTPISAEQLGSVDKQTLHAAVISEMRRMLEVPNQGGHKDVF
ncbi:MAG TPA: 1-acyl-sn-glycerol-3-phosphate acyltransferase [Anaerolineales bacterium]|nr:1-acyl-sn-glycerol-3-phosphate acyltransferase [Anaerolineales bacterium]